MMMEIEAEITEYSLTMLAKRIDEMTAHIVVVGLGYVGLPLAATLADRGFAVTGIDTNIQRAAEIDKGISHIGDSEPGLSELVSHVTNADYMTMGTLHVSDLFEYCYDADIIIICVDAPAERDADGIQFAALRSALESVARQMRPGQLIIIESTLAPGTMADIVVPTLQGSQMIAGEDFLLAYCPERVMPGKLLWNLKYVPRVIGGHTPEAGAMALKLYSKICDAQLDVTDCATAEMVKVTENAYRYVNIAFANEIAMMCEALGVNVHDVRLLVNQSPGRNMLVPGAGVGGHCLEKDETLLKQCLRDIKVRSDQWQTVMVQTPLITLAKITNGYMPFHVASLTVDALKEVDKDIDGTRVLVLGYAYLPNCGDDRNSPTAKLAEILTKLGADVTIHDPYIEEYRFPIKYFKALNAIDVIILMTAHDKYRQIQMSDLQTWGEARPLVLIDGRNVFNKADAETAGFIYRGVGIG